MTLNTTLTSTALEPGACRAGASSAQCAPAGTEPQAPFTLILEFETGGPAARVEAEVLLRVDPGPEIAVVVPCVDTLVPLSVVVLPVYSKRCVASRRRGGCSLLLVGLHEVCSRGAAGDEEQEDGELGKLHLPSCVVGTRCKQQKSYE